MQGKIFVILVNLDLLRFRVISTLLKDTPRSAVNKDVVIRAFQQLVAFNLDDRLFALRLETVTRVVRMVEVTQLIHSSPTVLGVINVEGQIVPVYNTRRLLQLQDRDPEHTDQLILAQVEGRAVALVVDTVTGVLEVSNEDMVQPDQILPAMNCVEGVIPREEGMIILYRLDDMISATDVNEQPESAP